MAAHLQKLQLLLQHDRDLLVFLEQDLMMIFLITFLHFFLQDLGFLHDFLHDFLHFLWQDLGFLHFFQDLE